MARKATEFSKHGVQMSDFVWTKDMSKKNRGICKTYIDGLLSDIEKRDRNILSLGEQLTKKTKEYKSMFHEMKMIADKDVSDAKEEYQRMYSLYRKEKNENNSRMLLAIICLLGVCIMGVLCFF